MRDTHNFYLEDQVIQFLIEESNNQSLIPTDESNLLVNASDARKQFNRGKGPSAGKNSNRVYTFCGKNGHTVDFCYAKHGHPNVNKDQYDQLVTLLQQANLVALASQPQTNPPTTNASVSNVIHDGHSPHDSSNS
ncbi:integrase catalytic region, partial [Trifolium medium]|nr:integrase catalytic region [Trifolium medium]